MSAFLHSNQELNLPESSFELSKENTTIGRHPSNDVSLLLEPVSRFHAKIENQAGVWILQDLNSSNGTFLNGERIASPRRLHNDDVITFGTASFTFVLPPSPVEKPKTAQSASSSDVHTSSVNIVGEELAESTILSTQFNVESTPLPGSQLTAAGKLDVESLKKANERLVSLYKLTEALRSCMTREQMLNQIMDLLFETLPADRGVVMTLESPESALEPQIVRFRHPQQNGGLTISRTIIQKCLDERVAILSRDAKIDARFESSDSILDHDIRSAMCVPLVCKHTLRGILFIDTQESLAAFNEDDLAFLTTFANDLALTLENQALAEENIRNERLAAVGQTIAGLAHNIKNILQLAKGGMELMDSSVAQQNLEDVEAFWPIVRKGIDRMQLLTQQMLDYSRATRPQLHEANVNEVLDDSIRSFQKDRVEAGVQIVLDLSPEVPARMIDPDGLFKALLNLVSNAVDAFEGHGGRILISTRLQQDSILIRVADNGKGIAKDKQARIFQPFFSTKGSKGTGLGLSMTKKYIEDMGGQISVDSEEGRGSIFTITLPPPQSQIAFDVDATSKSSSYSISPAPTWSIEME